MAENEKNGKEKKIIVDEDWKAQAQKEKEQLTEKEKQQAEQNDEKQDQPGEQKKLPEASLEALISMLATQAYFAMGLLRTEDNQDIPVDLDMAKFNIDLLAVLEDKTKDSLDENEKQLFEGTLHQLRMAYVQLSKK
jgi:hypothetical protein